MVYWCCDFVMLSSRRDTSYQQTVDWAENSELRRQRLDGCRGIFTIHFFISITTRRLCEWSSRVVVWWSSSRMSRLHEVKNHKCVKFIHESATDCLIVNIPFFTVFWKLLISTGRSCYALRQTVPNCTCCVVKSAIGKNEIYLWFMVWYGSCQNITCCFVFDCFFILFFANPF